MSLGDGWVGGPALQTNQVFGEQTANARTTQNPGTVKHAVWPSIIPNGQGFAEPSLVGTYREWTAISHSSGTTTITDSGLPADGVDFEDCIADAAASYASPDDALCHFVEVYLEADNNYRRYPITAVNGATELEVDDPNNDLGAVADGKYRITYNMDRAEAYGHTHDGIDSNPIATYNLPYYDDSGTPTPYDGPVGIALWDAITNAVSNDPVDLSEVTNGAPNLHRVKFRVEFLANLNNVDSPITFVLKTASGGIAWDVKTASCPAPSVVYRNTPGPAKDFFFMAHNFDTDASVPVTLNGGGTGYCAQFEFELMVEGDTLYADVSDLTPTGSLEVSIRLWCLGFTTRKP